MRSSLDQHGALCDVVVRKGAGIIQIQDCAGACLRLGTTPLCMACVRKSLPASAPSCRGALGLHPDALAAQVTQRAAKAPLKDPASASGRPAQLVSKSKEMFLSKEFFGGNNHLPQIQNLEPPFNLAANIDMYLLVSEKGQDKQTSLEAVTLALAVEIRPLPMLLQSQHPNPQYPPSRHFSIYMPTSRRLKHKEKSSNRPN